MLLPGIILSSALLAQGKLPKGPLPSNEQSASEEAQDDEKADSSEAEGDEDGAQAESKEADEAGAGKDAKDNKDKGKAKGKKDKKAKKGKGTDKEEGDDGAGADSAQGKTSSEPEQSAKTAEKKKNFKRRNCFLDIAEPPGPSAFFSQDGKNVWLLTAVDADGKITKRSRDKKPKKDKAPMADQKKGKNDANSVRYVLYKINFSSKKGEPVLSMQHGANAALVAYGDPPDAVSLVSFVGKTAACFEGPSMVVSLEIGTKGGDAIETKGKFQLAYTPEGMTLVDMRKDQVLQIDPESFQTKNARKVGEFERPLFFDPESKKLVSWYDDGEKRGLVAHTGDDENEVKRLEFKRDDRMLQSGEYFAIAHLDHLPNTIEIREMKEWTGANKPGQYKIKVPPAYSVKSAGVHVNFKKRLALVQGANYLAKTRWQRLFIYNYTMPEHLTVVPVTNTQYIHYAGIDPTGAYAIVEMRDVESRQTENVRLYDFATNNFADITFAPAK